MSLSSELGLPPLRGAGPLSAVHAELARADLTIGNLEGTLGSGGRSKCDPDAKDCVTFRAPAPYARLYASAGFDVLNVANNHAFDFGSEGLRATAAALGSAGIVATGVPGAAAVRNVGATRVAILGFAPYGWASDLRDVARARQLVADAARRADVVVVAMHAGAEGADQTHTPAGVERAFGEDRGDTRRFAHAVVDAGADLVLGSGPHVLRGLELYRERLIAYSLGNFLGYHTLVGGGTLALSGILRVQVGTDGAARAARFHSVRLVPPGVPRLDRSGASARLVSQLGRADFGARAATVGRDGVVRLPR
jgi:poly-gamma-glutamate capsule biosynthesis protein CapA/YwtB (metallophosphatase superfamily)